MRGRLLDKIVEQAKRDGTITKDELDIINKVSDEYGIYKNELESALSDHVITEEEFESLLKLRYKLYEKALAQALENGTITEDEKDILNQMQKNLQLTDRDIEIIESKYKETFLIKIRKILGEKEELLSKYGAVEIIKRSTKEYPLYKLLMVELSPEEQKIITEITNLFQSAVAFETEVSDPRKQESILIEKIYDEVTKYSDDPSQTEKLTLNIVYNITSIGVLTFLLKDDGLEEIMVIGPNKPVYVFHRKHGLCETNLNLSNLNKIDWVIDRLASLTQRSVNYLNPLMEASLPEGPRVNVTIPPASIDGATITIRKPHKDPFTIVDLINFKTITSELAAFLWMCVEGIDSPPNILIGGGTGSGKTVLLNVINGFIPTNERIVTIEDTPELELPLPHVIRLQTRPPGAEGTGELTSDILLKNTLRMRPDRILIGEIRGTEARTLFNAMNTGHKGVTGTIHSNSSPEVISRVENPPMDVPRNMLTSLDIIVLLQTFRRKTGIVRRITDVSEVRYAGGETVKLNKLYYWDAKKDAVCPSNIPGRLESGLINALKIQEKNYKDEMKRRIEILQWMQENAIRRIDQVLDVFRAYRTNPEGLYKECVILSKLNKDVLKYPIQGVNDYTF